MIKFRLSIMLLSLCELVRLEELEVFNIILMNIEHTAMRCEDETRGRSDLEINNSMMQGLP
jgi:hypothetical protein